ncbi:MAG TPA: hypothetical protein VFQ61_29965 [Polyangiaceae bacterium]|nr:hypothetical protein [Polyangiaceae bacterium]
MPTNVENRGAPADGRARFRRTGGLVLLLVGVLLSGQLLKGSWPRERTLIFRIPQAACQTATQLTAHFTEVGEREPFHGLTMALTPPSPRNLRQRITIPDGDYIVTLELTYGSITGPIAPEKPETSRARRVSLSSDETLVEFDAEGSE